MKCPLFGCLLKSFDIGLSWEEQSPLQLPFTRLPRKLPFSPGQKRTILNDVLHTKWRRLFECWDFQFLSKSMRPFFCFTCLIKHFSSTSWHILTTQPIPFSLSCVSFGALWWETMETMIEFLTRFGLFIEIEPNSLHYSAAHGKRILRFYLLCVLLFELLTIKIQTRTHFLFTHRTFYWLHFSARIDIIGGLSFNFLEFNILTFFSPFWKPLP